MIEGNPGTGKTTIALRCLLEGTQAGEKALYITLSETEEELRSGAASHGWIIPAALEIFELQPPETVILAPYGRDAQVAALLLPEARVATQICADVAHLSRELQVGAGLAIIAEEAVASVDLRDLEIARSSPLDRRQL